MKRYECMIKETDCNKFFAERAKYIKYHGSLKTNIYKKRKIHSKSWRCQSHLAPASLVTRREHSLMLFLGLRLGDANFSKHRSL